MRTKVTSFDELHQALRSYTTSTLFRGVKSVDFKLIPSIGRMQFITRGGVHAEESIMFQKFQQRAIPYLEFSPSDEWDWLTLAQHHGLPTRILDWTWNPLVAAYFAVEEEDCSDDGVIYALKKINSIDITKHANPFLVSDVGKYVPRHITRRLIVQAGLFTLHPEPGVPFESEMIESIAVAGSAKKEVKRVLYWYGIHRASLFPDLDGLSSHIRWLREDYGDETAEPPNPSPRGTTFGGHRI